MPADIYFVSMNVSYKYAYSTEPRFAKWNNKEMKRYKMRSGTVVVNGDTYNDVAINCCVEIRPLQLTICYELIWCWKYYI